MLWSDHVRAVILLSLVSLGACASRTPGRVVGGALTVIGGAMTISAASEDCPDPESEPTAFPTAPDLRPLGCGLGKGIGVAAGVVVLSVGLTTLLVNESIKREVAAPPLATPPASPPVADDSPELRQLVINAGVAARAGRCKSVAAIADRVEQLDPAFRHDGFLRDPAIAGCVD